MGNLEPEQREGRIWQEVALVARRMCLRLIIGMAFYLSSLYLSMLVKKLFVNSSFFCDVMGGFCAVFLGSMCTVLACIWGFFVTGNYGMFDELNTVYPLADRGFMVVAGVLFSLSILNIALIKAKYVKITEKKKIIWFIFLSVTGLSLVIKEFYFHFGKAYIFHFAIFGLLYYISLCLYTWGMDKASTENNDETGPDTVEESRQ